MAIALGGGDDCDIAFLHMNMYPFLKADYLKEFMDDIHSQFVKNILADMQTLKQCEK